MSGPDTSVAPLGKWGVKGLQGPILPVR
jgi:hypothetical protein